MTYDALETHLQANHFYPSRLIRVKNKQRIMEGFQIDSPSLLRESRQKRLEEIVGEYCDIKWMGNGETNNHFEVKLKK